MTNFTLANLVKNCNLFKRFFFTFGPYGYVMLHALAEGQLQLQAWVQPNKLGIQLLVVVPENTTYSCTSDPAPIYWASSSGTGDEPD